MSETALHAYHWADNAIVQLEELGDGDRAAFARAIWSELANTLEAMLATVEPTPTVDTM